MRDGHFERFRPVCPVCRIGGTVTSLDLAHVERRVGDDVLDGSLMCGSCRAEYAIIDGVPIIVGNQRELIAAQLPHINARDDLSTWIETILIDCAGPGSELDRIRFSLSTYGRSHWGDFDRERVPPLEGRITHLLDAALALLPEPPRGAWLDVGCSVGRTTFELAARTGDLALGVDLSFAALRTARRVATEGRARYPARRGGILYDRRDVAVDHPARDRVDFWLCDATALALPDARFAGVSSLNVLDCVPSPLGHLLELGRVLAPGAPALIATPFDWSTSATAVEGWIGGHTQRAPHGGSSTAELRRILSPDDQAGVNTGLAITAERSDVPWHVFVHDRATMAYTAHVVAAHKRA